MVGTCSAAQRRPAMDPSSTNNATAMNEPLITTGGVTRKMREEFGDLANLQRCKYHVERANLPVISRRGYIRLFEQEPALRVARAGLQRLKQRKERAAME